MHRGLVIGLFCAPLLLSTSCFAQTASPSDLTSAGGFLDVCGRPPGEVSKKSLDAVAKAPTSEKWDAMKKSWADATADHALCLAYLTGLYEGWEEGNAHGVFAALCPEDLAAISAGVPRDLKSVSDQQLQAQVTAMKTDVPCTPKHITIGEVKDVVVKYIRGRVGNSGFARLASTSALVPLALRDAFPCPAEQPTKQPSKDVR